VATPLFVVGLTVTCEWMGRLCLHTAARTQVLFNGCL